jgi:nitrate reductase gamma subunit
MKLETFLTIAAILAIAFGVGFLFMPALMLTQYGIVATPGTAIMARFFGVTILNLGLVLFLARRVIELATRTGIVRGSLIGAVLGLLVAIHGQRNGSVNALGWSSVAVYTFRVLGYAYFAFARSSDGVVNR